MKFNYPPKNGLEQPKMKNHSSPLKIFMDKRHKIILCINDIRKKYYG